MTKSTPRTRRGLALSLFLAFTMFTVTLTYATADDYKNTTEPLTGTYENTLQEGIYRTSISLNPDVTGVYAAESGYRLDLTINPYPIGRMLAEGGYKLDLTPENSFPELYDLRVTTTILSKTIIGQGYPASIWVTIKNQEFNYATFYVTTYANDTEINTQQVTIAGKASKTVEFIWYTTGFAKANWTIKAFAHPVPSEAITYDNTFKDGTVKIVTPGDVNVDGIVDIVDMGGLSAHWYLGPPVGPLGYDTNFDIDGDGRIDIADLAIVSAYWTGPPKGPLAP